MTTCASRKHTHKKTLFRTPQQQQRQHTVVLATTRKCNRRFCVFRAIPQRLCVRVYDMLDAPFQHILKSVILGFTRDGNHIGVCMCMHIYVCVCVCVYVYYGLYAVYVCVCVCVVCVRDVALSPMPLTEISQYYFTFQSLTSKNTMNITSITYKYGVFHCTLGS